MGQGGSSNKKRGFGGGDAAGVALLIGAGILLYHVCSSDSSSTPSSTPTPSCTPTPTPSGPQITQVEGEDEATYTCPILQDYMEDPMTSPCGHSFEASAIK